MNYYNEFDPNAAAWLKQLIQSNLIPQGDVDTRSITEVKPHELTGYTQCHFFAGIGGWSYALQLAGWPTDRPVWSMSCPCQPFSSAGKGLGTADERHLWPVAFNLIKECRPQYVFGEQVASAIGHGWLDGISSDLGEEGYACGSAVLGAHSIGAPHIRQRLYWMAYTECNGREQGRLQGKGVRTEAFGGEVSDNDSNDGSLSRLAQSECLRCERIEEQRPTSLLGAVDGAGESRESVGAHGSGSSGVADTEHDGLNRETGDATQQGSDRQDNGVSVGGCSGMGDTNYAGCPSCNSVASGAEERPEQFAHSSSWRNHTLIPCRDGKQRRIESRFKLLVNGFSCMVEDMRTHCDGAMQGSQENSQINHHAKTNSNSILSLLQQSACEEKVSIWNTGGFDGVSEKEILQPNLHGSCNGGKDQGIEREEQQKAVLQGEQGALRAMRLNEENSCSSHRSKPIKQRPFELEDVMRLLPQAYALAAIEGDSATIEELHSLFPASKTQWTLQYPLLQVAASWQCPSREEVERAWKSGAFDRWGMSPISPLAVNVPGRVGMLKGYGNAIVPQVAATFIQAAIESSRN